MGLIRSNFSILFASRSERVKSQTTEICRQTSELATLEQFGYTTKNAYLLYEYSDLAVIRKVRTLEDDLVSMNI